MRDVAYWPRTFLDEIEQAEVGPAPQFCGRSAARASSIARPRRRSGSIPYFGGTPDDAVADAYRACAIPVKPDEIRAADIVISTHDHVDHCHEGTVMPIVGNTAAICVAPATSAKLMRGWGVPDDRLREVSRRRRGCPSGRHDLRVRSRTTPANRARSPTSSRRVGRRSSSRATPRTARRSREVGGRCGPTTRLLAFGRTWYMNEEQMLAAARDLAPGTLLPVPLGVLAQPHRRHRPAVRALPSRAAAVWSEDPADRRLAHAHATRVTRTPDAKDPTALSDPRQSRVRFRFERGSEPSTRADTRPTGSTGPRRGPLPRADPGKGKEAR